MMIIVLVFVLLIHPFIDCTDRPASPNAIIDQPLIVCSADAIYLRLRSAYTFEGDVHLQQGDDIHDDGDNKCYHLLVTNKQIEVLIPHIDCNVIRIRSLNPAGLLFKVTLLVSFDRRLVTANDTLYQLQCFHKRMTMTNRRPSTAIDKFVSSPPPVCHYQLMKKADNGQFAPIHVVSLGDRIYHEWRCDIVNGRDCLLVSNCHVMAGDRRHLLIDARGCSIDETLLPNLIYHDDDIVVVSQSMTVFGIADRPNTYFQCQLNLYARNRAGKCDLRPECNNGSRLRRDLDSALRERNWRIMDAISQPMHVLQFGQQQQLPSCSEQSSSIIERGVIPIGAICVSRLSFAMIIASTLVVAVSSLIVITLILCRSTTTIELID